MERRQLELVIDSLSERVKTLTQMLSSVRERLEPLKKEAAPLEEEERALTADIEMLTRTINQAKDNLTRVMEGRGMLATPLGSGQDGTTLNRENPAGLAQGKGPASVGVVGSRPTSVPAIPEGGGERVQSPPPIEPASTGPESGMREISQHIVGGGERLQSPIQFRPYDSRAAITIEPAVVDRILAYLGRHGAMMAVDLRAAHPELREDRVWEGHYRWLMQTGKVVTMGSGRYRRYSLPRAPEPPSEAEMRVRSIVVAKQEGWIQ